MSTSAVTPNIPGLPPGAIVKPMASAASIPGLPAGAILRPVGSSTGNAPPPPTPPVKATDEPKQGFFSSLADQTGLSTLGNAALHPIDTAKNLAGVAAYGGGDTRNPIINGIKGAVANTVDNGKQAVQAARLGNWSGAVSHGISAIPIAGPMLDKATDQAAQNGMGAPGNSYLQDVGKVVTSPGAMGTLVGGAASLVAPAAIEKGIARIPGAAKAAIAGDVNKPMAGTDLTPAARYASAKKLGVNLPPAQATNSTVLRSLDHVNRDGFLSGGMHEDLAARNANALTSATDKLTSQMSPLDPEAGGKVIQQDLKQPFLDLQDEANDKLSAMSPLNPEQGGARVQSLAQAEMDRQHTASTAGYQKFSADYGDTPIANPQTVTGQAADIAKKNERFAQQYPSLVSHKVGNIVNDAGQLGANGTAGAPTVGDLIRSRSALLDMTRDPEIIKSSNAADIQRLIGSHDQAIMESLPDAGQKSWRELNQNYEGIKGTFDNPSNPMYQAIRTDTPSTLTTGIGGPTPEAVKSLSKVTGQEGVGIVQRGVTEKMLGRTEDGQYNLGNFSSKLQQAPEGYRQELFGNDGHEALQDLASRYRNIEPFQKAAYTENPEALTKGIGPKTAAGVRQLREAPVKPEGAAGPPAPRLSSEAMGAMQRGVAEDLLGTTRENGYNFNTFPGKLARMNEGYRNELFGPEHNAAMKDIADTSTALDTNYNRSGSGKLTQRIAEMYALPTGLPLIQYPLGKALTSTKLSEYLMAPNAPVVSRPWLRPPLPLLAKQPKKQ